MATSSSGYQEIEHTADWELLVWAPHIEGLFEQTARGMYSLMGIVLDDDSRILREFNLQAGDGESMLVNFLSELLYYIEMEGIGFDEFQLTVKNFCISAKIAGARILSMQKEIKAVTYHGLNIHHTERGLEVRIVFDV